MNIGEWILNILSPVGDTELIFCVMLIIFIDALIFPALPELIFVTAYISRPDPIFGIELFFGCMIAEITGIFILYAIIKKIKIPLKISKLADKYIQFLFVSNEKILLLNRIVPMVPFCGAFIALIPHWNLKKCIAYIMLGFIIKYGALLLASNVFYTYLGSEQASNATLCFVIVIIIVSCIASYFRKGKTNIN